MYLILKISYIEDLRVPTIRNLSAGVVDFQRMRDAISDPFKGLLGECCAQNLIVHIMSHQ